MRLWPTPALTSASAAPEIKTARLAGRTLRGREAVTVDELCDRWLEARKGSVREVTRETYAHALKPLRQHLGARRVQSLTYADALTFRTWLTTGAGRKARRLGWQAAKTSLAAFKQVLDHAVRVEGIVSENIARGIKPPKDHAPEGAVLERWTGAEVLAFIGHADSDPLAAAWRLASLGMRREEVLGLAWSDVDFTAGTVTVRQTRVRVSPSTDPRGWVIGRPKSAASRRVIKPDTVQPGTMTALKALRLRTVTEPKVNPGDLVVVDAAGAPVPPEWFSDRFAELAQEAGVPVLRLHSTRHTVAYLLHDAGVAPVRAAAFLGHTLAVHLSVTCSPGRTTWTWRPMRSARCLRRLRGSRNRRSTLAVRRRTRGREVRGAGRVPDAKRPP